MHASVKRLLDYVSANPMGRPKSWTGTPKELTRALNITPAVMTNWKARGISKEGAIAAEMLFGCPATHILQGGDDARSSQAQAQAKPQAGMSIDSALRLIADEVARSPTGRREKIALYLRDLALGCDDPSLVDEAVSMIQVTIQTRQSADFGNRSNAQGAPLKSRGT